MASLCIPYAILVVFVNYKPIICELFGLQEYDGAWCTLCTLTMYFLCYMVVFIQFQGVLFKLIKCDGA